MSSCKREAMRRGVALALLVVASAVGCQACSTAREPCREPAAQLIGEGGLTSHKSSGASEQHTVQQQQQQQSQVPQPAAAATSPSRHLQQQQCARGTHRCGGRCVSDTDPKTCGTRCTPCPAPAVGGVATCSARGACGVKCRAGFQQECDAQGRNCRLACRRVCPAGQQPDARAAGGCAVCPDDTFKPSTGPAACTRCPAGTRARGRRASDHDAAADCVAVPSCPPGQEAATATCRVCGVGFYKDAAGPGPCMPCAPATTALGDQAANHDSVDDCNPIACPAGRERDTAAGGCKVCAAQYIKTSKGPEPCVPCPPGTVTQGTLAENHDDADDCYESSCAPGQQPHPVTRACETCLTDTFQPKASSEACMRCPNGTRALGQLPSDHDEAADCLPGGLLPSGNRTGTTLQEVLGAFDEVFEHSRANTGTRGKGSKGGSGSNKNKRKSGACLLDCDGLGGFNLLASTAVAHLAGSPDVYRSDNPAVVRAGVNLLGEVVDQKSCATCVNAVIASAATVAVASALRVDGSSLVPLAHDVAYHCGPIAFGEAAPQRSCGTGWSFDAALGVMVQSPAAFFVDRTCLPQGVEFAQLSVMRPQLEAACNSAKDACGTASFKCSSEALSDGVWSIQRAIRSNGGALARIQVNAAFKAFFAANPTGVFNASMASGEPFFWHAVLLIGYNNTGMHWIARNSWGPGWADGGNFRIAYGALGVGHPEETYSLSCSPSSNDAATLATWSDPWRVAADPAKPGCYQYVATGSDTISGMVDHFKVDVLQFVRDNINRSMIPTELLGEPARPEPQLGGPWNGTAFLVCRPAAGTFVDKAISCSNEPAGGNAIWPESCVGQSPGTSCTGVCARGSTGSAIAVCQGDGQWAVFGSCLQEETVLLALKAALDPENRVLTDWRGGIGVVSSGNCKWPGVTCNADGAVVALDLSCKRTPRMTGGRLPSAEVWHGLKHLRRLDVSGCGLAGPLPASLSRSSLDYLDLGINNFTGGLPASWSAMNTLTQIGIYSNPNLGGELPAAWGNMTLLQVFVADASSLAGTLPVTWGNMAALKVLSVASNPGLSGTLPAAYSSMAALESFRAQGCGLSGTLPAAWSALQQLRQLHVYRNPGLSGTLPSVYSSMRALEEFEVNNCNLQGTLPEAYSALTSLRRLFIGFNPLHGTLPAAWSGMRSLEILILRGCNFTGGLPAVWAELALKELDVGGNPYLGGVLPDAYGRMRTLQVFGAYECGLHGTLPEAWGDLTALKHLALMTNPGLSATLPAAWSNMSSLERFAAYECDLQGSLPESWAQGLIKLNAFFVWRNRKLSGTLPATWGSMLSMQELDVSECGLRGGLPDSWSNMRQLVRLAVWGNPSLGGTLPTSYASMTAMGSFEASNCSLEGTIPSTWSAWQQLYSIDLHDNPRLAGCVPRSWSSQLRMDVAQAIRGTGITSFC